MPRLLRAMTLAMSLVLPVLGQGREEAQALVKGAIEYARANGTFKLIQAVNLQDPQFRKGELYLWIVDIEEKVMAAHGANPKLVGKEFGEARDSDGVAYGEKAVELAVEKGSGWFDYKYKHPETQKIEIKTCYVEKYKLFVIACGVYAK